MRAPFQVLIIPFIQSDAEGIQFCLFKRSDLNVWQAISGGGENAELPIEAAQREIREEIGVETKLDDFISLASIAYIPVDAIRGPLWGDKVLEVPEYTFGLRVMDKKIKIGAEHTEYGWFGYKEAFAQLEWQSNKNALSELNALILKKSAIL